MSAPGVLVVLAAAVLLYFLFRPFVRRRLRRRSLALVRRHRVHVNRFQIAKKLLVRESLMEDEAIREAARRHAERREIPFDAALDDVQRYLDEIVPAFSILSYYQVGKWAAGASLRALYRVHAELPPDEPGSGEAETQPVYVMNHRSNVDYVLVAYALLGRVSLSYAVGEWARVWPLEHLFKSFGSYFVRRGYREQLYHTVLERYVRRITIEGVAQGVFLEGGLSRDGRLRPPKLGLLDYICRAVSEPGFERDIRFVPAGINYDRVLEDRALLREIDLEGGARLLEDDRGPLARHASTASFVAKLLWRRARGEQERFGVAAVRFGEPVSLREFLSGREAVVGSPSFEERKPLLRELASELMSRIGRAVPATPVTLCARVLEAASGPVALSELEARAGELRERLLGAGGSCAGPEEIAAFVRDGVRSLQARRILRSGDETLVIADGQRPLVGYYANSLKTSGL